MNRLFALALTVVGSAACASQAARPTPAAEAADTGRIISTPITAIDTTQPFARDAFRRANEAAGAVDTIFVQPDSLILHIDHPVRPFAAIAIEARDAVGRRVAGFAPMLRVEDQTIVEHGAGGLIGRRLGRTVLIISPMSLDPNVRVRDTRAVVVLRVVP